MELFQNKIYKALNTINLNNKMYQFTISLEKIDRFHDLNFEGENAIECYHWHTYNKVLKWASKGLKEFSLL